MFPFSKSEEEIKKKKELAVFYDWEQPSNIKHKKALIQNPSYPIGVLGRMTFLVREINGNFFYPLS